MSPKVTKKIKIKLGNFFLAPPFAIRNIISETQLNVLLVLESSKILLGRNK